MFNKVEIEALLKTVEDKVTGFVKSLESSTHKRIRALEERVKALEGGTVKVPAASVDAINQNPPMAQQHDAKKLPSAVPPTTDVEG